MASAVYASTRSIPFDRIATPYHSIPMQFVYIVCGVHNFWPQFSCGLFDYVHNAHAITLCFHVEM